MRIIFAGTPEFAIPALEALLAETEHEIIAVYTQPDKVSGRGQNLQMTAVKKCALSHDIPVMQPPSLKGLPEQEQLKALKPDLMIVAAYGLLLPQVVLDIPVLGCINIHGSLLPRWRGASPIQQAVLAGDKETGISIMKMEAGLDTGPVFEKSVCEIFSTDTAGILHDRLALLGAKTLLKVLARIEELSPEKQQEEGACYAKKISKQDGLIDWNLSAIDIDRKVRAFNPWPVAYFFVDEQYVRVWQGKVLPEIHADDFPGTIIDVTSEGIDIATGNHTVFRIIQLQLAGSKVLSVKEYLTGHSLFFPGKRLT